MSAMRLPKSSPLRMQKAVLLHVLDIQNVIFGPGILQASYVISIMTGVLTLLRAIVPHVYEDPEIVQVCIMQEIWFSVSSRQLASARVSSRQLASAHVSSLHPVTVQ